MSLSLSYSIQSLKLKDETNSEGVVLPRAVYQTYWTITGTNADGQTGTWSGATPFTARNVPQGSFVPFEDLTEEKVTGWIQAVVDGDPSYKAHIIEQLEKSIDEQFGASEEIESAALPWASGESVTPTPPAAEEEAPEEPAEE